MRCNAMISLLWCVSSCVSAQAISDLIPDQITGSSKGTLTCKTEAAIVEIARTIGPPTYLINKQVMDDLIKKGDCLLMPEGWQLLEALDPPMDLKEDHGSKWTIRTPQGIVHMWGVPNGED